jgi:hypothetical protein
VQDGFHLLAAMRVKEARPIALRVARDNNQWHLARAAALVALMRIGEPADVAALAPLVGDGTSLGSSAAGPAVLGDVALAACVTLAGQSPGDYGFGPTARGTGEGRTEALEFGFPDGSRRASARQKWADYQAARPVATGGKR